MIISQVINSLIDNNISNSTILLAVSGGVDSVALLHIFLDKNIREKFNLNISVAHINHGLRKLESNKEEIFVSKLAKKNSIPFYVKTLSGKNLNDNGIEEWARKERYSFFNKIKKKHNLDYIVTAHTANDQVETILMRMARGAGIKGLCGIRTLREDGLFRPLLKIEKSDIYKFMKNNGYKWYEDSSNSDNRYTRNLIRNTIIPSYIKDFPNINSKVLEFSELMQRADKYLKPLITIWINDHLISESDIGFSLTRPFKDSDNLVASEAVATLFRRAKVSLSSEHINNFLNNHNTAGEFLLSGNFAYFPSSDRVDVIDKSNISSNYKIKFKLGESITLPHNSIIKSEKTDANNYKQDIKNKHIYLDFQKTGNEFYIKIVEKKELFQALGSNSEIDIIKYLKKQKLNKFQRERQIALYSSDNKIIWIPNVAISESYKIDNLTKESAHFSIY